MNRRRFTSSSASRAVKDPTRSLNPCAQGKIFCIILATSLHARGRPVGYDAASDIISGDAEASRMNGPRIPKALVYN